MSPAAAERLELMSRTVWDLPVANGVSGLEVDADGESFVAVSDRGWIYEGRLIRDAGDITDVALDDMQPIIGQDGWPVTARRVGDWSDAEGLAIAEDGTRWITFERWSHIWRFDPGTPRARFIKDHPDFAAQPENRQLEAAAIDASGVVFALPETAQAEGFPIYRLDDDVWSRAGHLPRLDGFSPVGADFGPDGRLWVLERKLVVGLFWQNRIRVLDVARPEAAEIVWTGGPDAFWNMEGLAVWQAPDGLRIVCVSDNNQDRSEPTEFVEFRVVH